MKVYFAISDSYFSYYTRNYSAQCSLDYASICSVDFVTMSFNNRFILKIQLSGTNLGKLNCRDSFFFFFNYKHFIHYMNPDFQQLRLSCQKKVSCPILLQK